MNRYTRRLYWKNKKKMKPRWKWNVLRVSGYYNRYRTCYKKERIRFCKNISKRTTRRKLDREFQPGKNPSYYRKLDSLWYRLY